MHLTEVERESKLPIDNTKVAVYGKKLKSYEQSFFQDFGSFFFRKGDGRGRPWNNYTKNNF